jgi:APA family basic amino acid/polyamine antiporter
LSELQEHTRTDDSALLRAVGFWALAASIVNVTIGGSIFALPGILAVAMGAAAPLAFIFGALLFVPIVLCFAAAGSRITASGGPYSYVHAAFGRFPGFVVAAVFWISNVAGSGSMAAALADQLSHAAPRLGEGGSRALLLLAVYCSLMVLNAWGIRAGAAAIMAFAAAKSLPLILLVILGVRYIHLENLRVTEVPTWTSIGSSLVIVVFAFSGIETALSPSGEVRDPAKVVPRAAFAGVAVVIGLYVGLQVVAQGVLGTALVGNHVPLSAIADIVVAGGGGVLVLTATVSLIGVLQGDLLGSSRLLYALARDGFLPSPLDAVTKTHRVPMRAVVAHGLVAWFLAALGSFTTLALVSGGAICLVYIGCCAAAWRLQSTSAGETDMPLVLPGRSLIPLLGIAGLLLILATLRLAEWIAIGCAVLAVSVLYMSVRRGSQTLRKYV